MFNIKRPSKRLKSLSGWTLSNEKSSELEKVLAASVLSSGEIYLLSDSQPKRKVRKKPIFLGQSKKKLKGKPKFLGQ